MNITNYSTLKTAVMEWLHRSDLNDRVADFIGLGEAQLNRMLRVRDMETSATITVSTSNSYASIPTGFLEAVSLVDDFGEPLVPLTPTQLAGQAYGAEAGRPMYYRLSNRIDFERRGDQAYLYTMRYYKRLDIETDGTNAVLTSHPDIYLYAALLAAEPYVVNDQRMALWATMLERLISDANWRGTRNINTLKTDIGAIGRSNIMNG